MDASQTRGIDKLLWAMKQLRDPQEGCPWDRQQTHESLIPYLLEEAHEYIDALQDHGPHSSQSIEELGDVLFQVVFHAQLLSEAGKSNFDSIAEVIADKLVRRHPHVFDANHPKFQTPEQVGKAWEQLKAKERERAAALGLQPKAESTNTPKTKQLKSIPRSLAAFQRAERIGEKAASFGFDWPDASSVLEKVSEELAEWTAEQGKGPEFEEREQEELGDVLFSLAQYCRKKGWDGERILAKANQKFLKRFEALEQKVATTPGGPKWENLNLEQLEALWQSIKTSP